jgi:energy-coupling factor transport system ATP-binding protein
MRLEVDCVSYWFFRGTPWEVKALDRVSFALECGEALGITGSGGSGATTLARIITGLIVPDEGRILIDGIDATGMEPGVNRGVGTAFQRPESQIFEETVRDDVAFSLTKSGDLDRAEIDRRVEEACRLVGLDIERVGDRNPLSLPEGAKRQVALAGILVADPRILILDEPATGLEEGAVTRLADMIAGFKARRERSVMILAHRMDPFLTVLDRLIVMDGGRILAAGPPWETCEALDETPELRTLVPAFARFLLRLRRNGVPLPQGEFRSEVLADAIADQCSPGKARKQ